MTEIEFLLLLCPSVLDSHAESVPHIFLETAVFKISEKAEEIQP